MTSRSTAPAFQLDVPGSYVFASLLERPQRLATGRLGTLDYPRGHYLYVGSARGPGGLRARLRHHWRGAARPRWHIDYLRRGGTAHGAVVRASAAELECRWAGRLASMQVIEAGPDGFGASDCRCDTHLYRVGATASVVGDGALASLLLWLLPTGRWLGRHDLDRVLGVAPDTATPVGGAGRVGENA